MAEVPVPFMDEEIDTDEGLGAGVTVGVLILGFAVFAMAQSIGSYLANQANSTLGELIGFNPATGESNEADLV